jgi:glycogen synthase
MRIAFVTSEFLSEKETFDGGLSNYIYKVAVELIKYGHEPIIFVISKKDEMIFYDNIEVHRVSPKNTFFYKLMDKLTSFKYQTSLDVIRDSYFLNKRLKEVNKLKKIDLIQYPNYRSVSFLSNKKIKSVLRISSYQKLLDEANGLFYKSIKERQMQILEDLCYRRAKNIFGPSNFLAEKIQTKFKKEVTVIETPYINEEILLDTRIIDQVIDASKGNPYLLYFGRLAMLKGTVDIADMLNAFLRNNPNFYFVIIGKDVGFKGKPMLDYIYKNVGEFKDRVLYFKEQPHNTLFPVIKSSSLVLMPSRIENFPNACIEAMALNKIVVATRGISFEQLIEHGKNGFLCKNADSADLSCVIQEVLELSPEKRKEIELNAGKSIQRLHPEITVKKLVDYYQSIIKT